MKGVDTQEEGLLKKGIQRRDFFKLAAAGGAALAATSCASDPVETLVPFLTPPGDLVSGEFVDYASSCNECAAACGVIVRTREGRVINLEGNAKHPISKGGVCAIGQSVVQENYSPARVLTPMLAGIATTWQEADLLLAEAFSAKKKIVWVTRPGKSATKSLIERWGKNYGVEIIEFETNPYQSLVKANLENFGEAGVPHYNIQDAATLVAFGADFLESWHSVVENSRAFAEFRSLKNGKKGKFFHFSPHLSLTASNADKWYACPAGSETKLALALASALLNLSRLSNAEKDKLRKSYALPNPLEVEQELGLAEGTLQKIAKAFGTAGKGLALAGGISTSQQENASLQAAVNLVNYLGNSINSLVRFGADYAFAGDSLDRLTEVLKLAAKGEIGVLVLDKVNLVHAFPDKQLVQQAVQNTAYSIGFYSSHNDTAQLCRLVLPTKTSLESWDVYHARSGVISLQQAAMVPLPQNLSDSVGDVLLRAAKTLNNKAFNYPSFQDFVQAYYKEAVRAADKTANVNTEGFWVDSVMQGGFFKETLGYKNLAFRPSSAKLNPAKQAEGLRLVAFNSNLRNANALTSNRAWLDEIAPPISQLAWDSWVEIHPETAMKLNIRHAEEVLVKTNKAEWKAMAYVYHGVHKDAVAIPAGYGQKVLFPNYASRRGLFIPFTADNPTELKEVRVGENLSDLLNLGLSGGDLLYSATVTIEGTGKPAVYSAYDGQWRDDIYAVVSESEAMYGDRSQKGRGMYRRVAIDDLEKDHAGEEGHGGAHARSFHVKEGTPFDFYLPVAEQVKKENIGLGLEPKNVTPYHDPYRFEMVIDLDKCTGCSACVVACYAENNIPVVGKERVMYQRQMNWIRIERYFDPDENGEMVTNLGPNACQQCSNAGCEPVCPVYATYHNPDGLNAQVYNRCVGTRYCANNCIYKLRRFNWRTYEFPTPLNYQLNPDVTVRTKGVMEKCTFCVQRIRKAKEVAKFEGRLVQDGEIRTACQSVCPTGAITFGNSVDKESQLSKVKESPRGYHQLEEVNFQPALTYLSRTRHKDLFQE